MIEAAHLTSTDCKLQIMNLAVKMGLKEKEEKASDDTEEEAIVSKLMKYILELARYDSNTDIRDRCRSLRALVFKSLTVSNEEQDEQSTNKTINYAKIALLMPKPVPEVVRNDTDNSYSERYEFGSLSFSVAHTAIGYVPVPEWPVGEQPDTTVRNKPTNSTADSARW